MTAPINVGLIGFGFSAMGSFLVKNDPYDDH